MKEGVQIALLEQQELFNSSEVYKLHLQLLYWIIIIIITSTIFIVLSSTAPAICESSLWFIWAQVGQRQVAANSQAKLQTLPLSPPVGC